MGEYKIEALEEAKGVGRDFLKQIEENIINSEGQITETDLEDYAEDYVSNRHLSLKDAVYLLEDLEEYEETDSVYWEGIEDPKKTVIVIAQITYKNAVRVYFRNLMELVNDDINAAMGETLFFDFDEWLEQKDIKPLPPGAFEWMPGVSEEERAGRDERYLKEEHARETKEKVKQLVKESLGIEGEFFH